MKQSQEERSYHIFYYLLAGAPKDLRSKLQLAEPKDYRYLNQGAFQTLSSKDSVKEFEGVQRAMRTLHMAEKEQSVWTTIAAVLHLGNLVFVKDEQANWEGASVKNEDGKMCMGFNSLLLNQLTYCACYHLRSTTSHRHTALYQCG